MMSLMTDVRILLLAIWCPAGGYALLTYAFKINLSFV